MKTHILTLLLSFILFIINPALLRSQSELVADDQTANSFSADEWRLISQRWEKYQTQVEIITNEREVIKGQLVYTSPTEIAIYKGPDVLIGSRIMEDLIHVPLESVYQINLMKGGPKYTGLITGLAIGGGVGAFGGLLISGGWSVTLPIITGGLGAGGGAILGKKIQTKIKTNSIRITPGTTQFVDDFKILARESIFTDSLTSANNMDELISSSRVARRIFPENKLRVSFNFMAGTNGMKSDIEELIESSPLHPITDFYPGPLSIEFFDLSYRFNNKYIVGGQLNANLGEFAHVFYEDYQNFGTDYSYTIQIFSFRLYSEYVINPKPRYFTKRHELLVGGGIVFASPMVRFNYGYTPDPLSSLPGDIEKIYNPTLTGLLVKTSFHYYLSPGFSVSAGIEGDLYPPMSFPEEVYPTSNMSVNIKVPAYTLSFSTLRAKVGLNAYF